MLEDIQSQLNDLRQDVNRLLLAETAGVKKNLEEILALSKRNRDLWFETLRLKQRLDECACYHRLNEAFLEPGADGPVDRGREQG